MLYNFRLGFVSCQCDDFCIKNNDCYDDFNGNNSENQEVGFSCISAGYNPIHSFGIGFYLIDSCLKNFKVYQSELNLNSKDIKRWCTAQKFPLNFYQAIKINIIKYLPVSVDNRMYKNIFCAICNNKTFAKI